MLLKVRLAELMTMIQTNLYRKFVIINRKGEIILYVKLQKALYGLLRSSLLFYKMLVKDLYSERFILNPYEPCVENRMVNGHHMKVAWHVDKSQVLQKYTFEITMLSAYLESVYGEFN